MAMNLALSISVGGANQAGGCYGNYGGYGEQPIHRHHHHHHCEGGEGPEKPDRNPFLDFLTAPLQALGKGGNQNDKEYDKYLAANQGCNLLKG